MKLFHCIVVMGAAIGAGCGGGAGVGGTNRPEGGSDAGMPDAFSGAGDAACVQDTGVGFGVTPGSCSYSGACRGTAAAPLGPQDCAHPQQLECNPGSPTCDCNASAPLVPTDCAATGQFFCDDWSQPCGCHCQASAPGDPSRCGCDAGVATDAAVSCGLETWVCHSYDPPVGCGCSVPIL